jgi:hypothetical protein
MEVKRDTNQHQCRKRILGGTMMEPQTIEDVKEQMAKLLEVAAAVE